MNAATVVVVLLVTFVTACGTENSGDSPDLPTSQPSVTPSIETVELMAVMENAEAFDGEFIEVRGSFWSDGDEQYLVTELLESFPPQISRSSAMTLIGDVPEGVLSQLDQSGPSFGDIVWGSVVVTGQVLLDSNTNELTLEIATIEVA